MDSTVFQRHDFVAGNLSFLMRYLFARAVCYAVLATAFGQTGAPVHTVEMDAAILESGRLGSQCKALIRLGGNPDPTADKILLAQLERQRAGKLPPALWLDLFQAAAKRKDADIAAFLAERERTLAQSHDPIARFTECLEGGDGEAGRAIFTKKPEAGCVRCHSIEDKGGKIGPDLTWLRHSVERMHILESIIAPNSTIAAGFASAALTLKDGTTLAGVISAEGADELTITNVADGKKRTVKTADITERAPLPSPMPPHFSAALDKRAIRDLVEFLAAGD